MSETIRAKGSQVQSSSDLPPPRDRKGIRPVSPPLSNTPLHRFNYYIAIFGVLFISFYAWRLLQWKTEVGGWYNLATGTKSAPIPDYGASRQSGSGDSSGGGDRKGSGEATVEDRINQLAEALGMPSKDLARAIADAVRENVPPASLSSVASHEPSGSAARYVVDPSAAAAEDQAAGSVNKVAAALEAIIGLDEPPSDIAS